MVSLFKGGISATLEVSDGKGGWIGVEQGKIGAGLLDLLGLFGSSGSAQIKDLPAGEYRFTLKLDPSLVSVGTSAAVTLNLTNDSLTEFTGEAGGPIVGNVVTDIGVGGETDNPGTGGPVKVQVQVNGEFVDAGAEGAGTVLQGLYGTLTIDVNGGYTYVSNGNPAGIGKVDAFEYQLINAEGGTSKANLYVRIDSPGSTIVWNDDNPAEPGVITPVANDDVGSAQIHLVPLVGAQESLADVVYAAPFIGQTTHVGTTHTVAANTTATFVLNNVSTGALLSGTTYVLQKLVGTQWVDQTPAAGTTHTYSGMSAGDYRVKGQTFAVLGGGSVTITEKVTTTFLNQLVPGEKVPATGNVLTDTSLSGSDTLGSPLTVLSVKDAGGSYVAAQVAGTAIAGIYGTLLLFADGKYIYTLNANLTEDKVGQVDHFTYKLTSPSGDSDTAELYIRLESPERPLFWDDSNPGAPGSSTPVVAALSVEEHSTAVDDSAATDGHATGDHSDHTVVADTEFTHVDNVAGVDGLLWEGGDAAINLTDLIGKVSGIDTIDLNTVSAVDLTLSLEDLVSLTGPESERLMIQGDDQDSVHLTGNWSSGVSQVENGLEYVIYTSQEDPTHQLWIQNGISVV
ncbi:hypothetical protein QN356_16310 [Pseudomonas sp. CCC3.1]|nr:BapA/Bap/LapF family large adhesin [Pseudomonas sp. CCC3.1]MEB0207031.1 hypothetical protein [Pseudomonas sp. CCC3.1]